MPEILNILKNKYPEYWQDSTGISHTRQKTLEFLLVAYCGLGILLALLHFVEHRTFLLSRVLVFTVSSLVGLGLLRRGVPAQKVAHFAIISLSLAITTSSLLYKPGYYTAVIQFIFVLLSSSFYLLGARWGTIYSLVNMLISGMLIIIRECAHVSILQITYTVDQKALGVSVLYNYAVLLYIHFRFFKDSELAGARQKALGNELRVAIAEASDLSDYKTNFLITVSHEIRTPLHAIVGGVDILMADSLAPRQEKTLESVKFSATVLSSVVDDIMNLNDLEAGQIRLRKEAFLPSSIVDDIYKTLQPAAEKKGLALTLVEAGEFGDLSVIGDPVRLAQVLMNLISNAIRHTEHGHVEIQLKSERDNDNQVKISFKISDTGIGIPLEFQPYVFEPFKIIPSRTKKQYSGTGLGLPLVQKLVNLLGGSIELISEEGAGTSFFFSIAYALDKQSTARRHYPVAALAAISLNVLVAEDNKMNAMILKTYLQRWKVQFDIVENGQLAVELMKQCTYHAILMDINMPVMDGIEASRQIRKLQDPVKAGITIIALTAADRKSLESAADQALFDDWMSKPFQPQLLHNKLSQLQKALNVS